MENIEDYQAILFSNLSFSESTMKAINSYSSDDLETALNLFSSSNNLSEIESLLSKENQMAILERMGKWDKLSDLISMEIDSKTASLLDSELSHVLSYFIKTNSKPSTISNGKFKSLIDISSSSNFLESNYATELAIMFISDESKAKQLIQLASDSFLSKFALQTSTQHQLLELKSLQRIEEVREFLYLNKEDYNAVSSLAKNWKFRIPDSAESLEYWNEIISARVIMLKALESKHNLHQFCDSYSTSAARAARNQGNMFLADSWLKQCTLSTSNDFQQDFEREVLLNALRTLQIARNPGNAVKIVDTIISNFESKFMRNNISQLNSHSRSKFKSVEAEFYSISSILLLDHRSLNLESQLFNEKYTKRLLKANSIEPGSINGFFVNRAFEYYIESINEFESAELEEIHMKFVSYCDKIVRFCEQGSVIPGVDLNRISVTLVKYVLKAMIKFGSSAIDFFPRVMQLTESRIGCVEDFIKLAADIPTWKFLKWIPQMTALLDKVDFLSDSIRRVSLDYPSALIFPLTLSSEQYSFDESSSSQRRREVVKRLVQSCSSPLMTIFMRELIRLTDPILLFKEFLDKISVRFI